MFDSILGWIGKFLAWIDHLTGSYVIALFIFALIIEIILLPLSIKQQKNSQKTAKLRPKEAAIRKKYAGRDDQVTKQKMGTEIQELYQKENVSPFSGCLPLLIQLPVVIALYRIVMNPLKYVVGMNQGVINTITAFLNEKLNLELGTKDTIIHISKISEINKTMPELFEGIKNFVDKSGKVYENGLDAFNAIQSAISKGLPNFDMFGLDLANFPSFKAKGADLWLLLVPVLTFVVYFASMKISRKLNPPPMAQDSNMGCSNNIMDLAMPLMSVFITFRVPAAIGIYWIFKSIITTIKQIIIAKAMPLPTFTEEDYKEAEKEILGKGANKKVKKSENAGKVRSLHHIDDEDFIEEKKEEKSATKKKKSEPKNSGMIESAKLKDDSKDSVKEESNQIEPTETVDPVEKEISDSAEETKENN